jgi:hypothetical protein
MRADCELSLGAQLCPAMYLSLFFRKYRPTYRQLHLKLRRELRPQLNPALNLKLDLNINPSLNHALFATLHLTSNPSFFASLFGSMLESMFRSFRTTTYLALYRQRPRGRRPGGRGVDGEIVVRNGPTTTYRCVPTAMAAHVFRPPCPAELYNVVEWTARQKSGTSDGRAGS